MNRLGRPAVFVDRDGVINRALVRNGKPYSPMSPTDLKILPGAADACERLRAAGFAVVAITNQPEMARGRLSADSLQAIHDAIRRQVPLDAMYVCPHDDADKCTCRKPAPGLIERASQEMGLDPAASYLVGDRWRDIEAGRRAGCLTILIEEGYDERRAEPDIEVGSLSEAADWIITQREEALT